MSKTINKTLLKVVAINKCTEDHGEFVEAVFERCYKKALKKCKTFDKALDMIRKEYSKVMEIKKQPFIAPSLLDFSRKW